MPTSSSRTKRATTKDEPAIAKCPHTIKVLGFLYSIILRDEDWVSDANAIGMCSPNRETIYLYEDLPPRQAAETLLHEVFHAAFYAAKLNANEQHLMEEEIVSRVSSVMHAIMTDNPALYFFIARCSHEEVDDWEQEEVK